VPVVIRRDAAGVIGVAVMIAPVTAAAHVGTIDPRGLTAWTVALPILVAAALYAIGTARLEARGREHGRLRIAAFALGCVALWVALLSRIDRWGSELFALHMVQHELLMLVVAPLLVAGRPLPVFLWAFPGAIRVSLGRATRATWVAGTWRFVTRAPVAWGLHALAIWAWHAPVLFDAALRSGLLHDAQHLSFLLTALLFWFSLLRTRRAGLAAVIYLFTTTLHTSVLGALLTFAPRPVYAAYLQSAGLWNLTPLEDQQLGGLIMWIPGSLVYVALALLILGATLDGRRTVPGLLRA
jgi:putative membrane protein